MVVLVTGASGFIGGAITERVVDRAEVRSLTLHPSRQRFGTRVRTFAYDFDQPRRMAEAFDGVDVFVNTYYIRFKYAGASFEQAVARSRALIDLAKATGVGKIVHVSVSNADERSHLPYYANKARIEQLVRDAGLDFTILRPALVVGPGDILVNNIAFFLRRLPVFAMFGKGDYRLQPMAIDAFADIAVEAIDGGHSRQTVAVAGPRDWTFLELVRAIRRAVGSRALIVPAPPWLAVAGLKIAGVYLGDVVLTRDEISGLTEGYLCSDAPLRRGIDFDEWLAASATSLGRTYASELERHFVRPPKAPAHVPEPTDRG